MPMIKTSLFIMVNVNVTLNKAKYNVSMNVTLLKIRQKTTLNT